MNLLNFFKKLFRKHIKPCVKANRDLLKNIYIQTHEISNKSTQTS